MKYSLDFSEEHDYSADHAISVPVRLYSNGDSVAFDAYLDTGSTFCVFKRGLGEMLGINVGSGRPLRIATVIGTFEAFGHLLTLETLGRSFDVTVYFAGLESFSRNVLGRRGWLDQVRVGIVESESKLYLSRYDE